MADPGTLRIRDGETWLTVPESTVQALLRLVERTEAPTVPDGLCHHHAGVMHSWRLIHTHETRKAFLRRCDAIRKACCEPTNPNQPKEHAA